MLRLHPRFTEALLRQFLAARSIIEVALRPLKLTEQAHFCLGKRNGTALRRFRPAARISPASPERYVGNVLQLPIAICCCQRLATYC